MSTIVNPIPKQRPSSKISPPQAPELLGETVLDAIHRLMHLYRGEQYQSRYEDDLTHMEGKVLRYFANHPGSTLKELGHHVVRDKGQLAKLINALKTKGYLIANSDEVDKRQIRLELSKEGAQVQKQLRLRTQQLAERACEGLSAQQRQDLMAWIEHMSDNLKPPSSRSTA